MFPFLIFLTPDFGLLGFFFRFPVASVMFKTLLQDGSDMLAYLNEKCFLFCNIFSREFWLLTFFFRSPAAWLMVNIQGAAGFWVSFVILSEQ
jgi:hypothetical protein